MIFGPPSSGKSTLAKYLALKINAQIISTDSIRRELNGDESIQGDWENIESSMQDKIIDSINQKHFIKVFIFSAKEIIIDKVSVTFDK